MMWWAKLNTVGRDQITALARDGGSFLPGDLFEGLVVAGVLVVTMAQRLNVMAGATFPMPADVLAFVLAQST